jgi:hypothetical protein
MFFIIGSRWYDKDLGPTVNSIIKLALTQKRRCWNAKWSCCLLVICRSCSAGLGALLGWWQCGRQRGREEAAAARARARGRRRAMALAPGESGRYRLALARAGAPARARAGREGGEALAGRERGRERRGAIWLVHVLRSDWSTCASRCN